VLESTRAKENAVKEETAEQLDAFRKQRALAEQSLLGLEDGDSGMPGDLVGTNAWSIKKKKRRRDQDRSTESAGTGTKLRKLSSTAADEQPPFESVDADADADVVRSKDVLVEQIESTTATTSTKEPFPALQQKNPAPVSPGLGLGGYSSDEDD
jgi:hypothetical protein